MSRAVRVAKEDATTRTTPRRVREFFSDGNGICALCGCGLGKRYATAQRRDHEKSFQHTENHTLYRNAFGPAREEHLTHLRAMHDAKVKFERMESAMRLADEFGATDWLENGDASNLKVALWDAMANPTHTNGVAAALAEHQRNVRASLLQRAAAVATGDDHGAFTVAEVVMEA